MISPVSTAESGGEVIDGGVEALLRLASGMRVFRSADGRLHAQVAVGDRREIYGLRSAAFRDWLVDSYLADRGELPSANSVGRVVGAIEARARFSGATPALYVRVGRYCNGGGADCYLDLGDSSGQAVRINTEGWSVVEEPPVQFQRVDGLLPLPAPQHDGSIERLRQYVNVSEADFPLLIGWMAAALIPEGPYPILAIHGEQGSAKSTLAKVIRKLIDPQASSVLAAPQSTRDLMVTAVSGWLLVYDNVSVVPNWLSDSLCRLATGGGFAGRALFTNDARSVIQAQRPVILNGIDEFVRREDLADRCVFLHLPPIAAKSRRLEGEFWRSFDADYPAIVGGILDAIVGGLRELPSVRVADLPRMADFACFGEAVGRGLGWKTGMFLSAYSDNRAAATVSALEESPLAAALITWNNLNRLAGLSLSATEILEYLATNTPARVKASARWPRSPLSLSNELRRIGPQLRMRGISVKFARTTTTRLITLDVDFDVYESTDPDLHRTDSEDD